MAINFDGRHFKKEIILQAVRWYVAYSLSYRDIEELMKERGVDVDHFTIHRWVVRCSLHPTVRQISSQLSNGQRITR